MFKYLKYELKGSYKIPLTLLVLVILWCPILYSRVGIWSNVGISSAVMLTCFGSILTTFIYVVHLYERDFSEDRGYLTFTLPLKVSSILWSKSILSFIWLGIMGLACVTFMAIIFKPLNVHLFNSRNLFQWVVLICIFIGSLYLILSIFLAITLSKVAFKNKKLGGISFVIFILLNSAIGFLNIALLKLFPQALELPTGKLINMEYLGLTSCNIIDNSVVTSNNITTAYCYINIVSVIFYIALIIGLFTFNSYLIDKKMNL